MFFVSIFAHTQSNFANGMIVIPFVFIQMQRDGFSFKAIEWGERER